MESAKDRRNRHRKKCITKAAVSLTIPPLLLYTKNKLEIRSRPLLEPGSDYHYLVQKMGVEPTRYYYHTDLNRARLPIPPLLRYAALASNVGYYKG